MVIKIVEVGIPVYKARDTLPATLDSLVAQTKKNFIVCLSIDGDGENYQDIINTYINRGLKIRVINSDTNLGAGGARQKILDTTICDYIMFLDADDIFTPRAVEVLYTNAKAKNCDIMRGSFIRERSQEKEDILMSSKQNVITWFHAKIYRVQFLKEKNIRFLEGLRTDEDAYFNAVAWNSTQNKEYIDEVLYIWRDNKNSITRAKQPKDYFCKNYLNYIRSQVEALKTIFRINNQINNSLIGQTLINIYYYYMKARFYKIDEKSMDDCISSLKKEKWMQIWLINGSNWIEIINRIKPGAVYDDEFVVFYNETFNIWASRLLKEN